MPLSVISILWTMKASFGSSPGITSTTQVSAPTATTFCEMSHFAASLPIPGAPELKTAFCAGYCSKRLPQPVWTTTMSPSRSVTLYILRPAWMSAPVMTVPLSRQSRLQAALPLNFPAALNTLTMSTSTPRVAKLFRCSSPSLVMLFWLMNLPIGVWLK